MIKYFLFNYLNKDLYRFFFIELQFRIFYSIISIILTFYISFLYKEQLIFILTKFLLYNMNSHRYIFTALYDIFFSYLYFCIYISIIVNMPFVIISLLYFFFNSLYNHELKFLFYFIFLIIIFFFISLFFSYYFFLPNFLKFFLNFEKDNLYFPLHLEAKLDEILILFLKLIIYIIFCFQIPVLIFCLKFLNIINEFFLIKFRKFFYILILIFSALIAPPEIIIQILFIFFFIFFFEFFIFIMLFIFYLN